MLELAVDIPANGGHTSFELLTPPMPQLGITHVHFCAVSLTDIARSDTRAWHAMTLLFLQTDFSIVRCSMGMHRDESDQGNSGRLQERSIDDQPG